MNPGMKYIKTEKGRNQVAERGHSLSALQRRLLIMIDGTKTVNDLGFFVRAGELDAVLAFLLEQELIVETDQVALLMEPVAPGFAAAESSEPGRPATSLEEFKKVRRHASSFVSQQLGDAGAPICDAIDRCYSPAELRKLLRGIEIFVGERLGAETTQTFARHFGSLLL